MAFFDPKWFTGLETAATSLFTALAAIGGTWLALRRKYSEDSTEIKKDRGEWDWISDRANALKDALRENNELRVALREEERKSARLEARVQVFDERQKEMDDERLQRMGACEERVRSLSEQVLDQKLANGRLFMALAKVDQPTAERLLLEHMRPPTPKDDKP